MFVVNIYRTPLLIAALSIAMITSLPNSRLGSLRTCETIASTSSETHELHIIHCYTLYFPLLKRLFKL